MKIVRREALAMVLQLPARRPDRLALDVHLGLAGGAAALLEVARRAGCGDIFPAGAASLSAGHHMIEGQFPVRSAINAAKAIAQEQVEPRERRIFVGSDE